MKIKILILVSLLSPFVDLAYASCPDLASEYYYCSYQSGDRDKFSSLGLGDQAYFPHTEKGINKLALKLGLNFKVGGIFDTDKRELLNPSKDIFGTLSCNDDNLEALYRHKDSSTKIQIRALNPSQYEGKFSEFDAGESTPNWEVRMTCRVNPTRLWPQVNLTETERKKITSSLNTGLKAFYTQLSNDITILNPSILRIENTANIFRVFTKYQIAQGKEKTIFEQNRIIYMQKDKSDYKAILLGDPLSALVNQDIAKKYNDLDAACDQLAENPLDPNKTGAGVAWQDLNAPFAEKICQYAVDAANGKAKGKTKYQLLRAKDKLVDGWKDYERTYILPDLKALGKEYPFAYFSAAALAGSLGDYEQKHRLLGHAKQIPAAYRYQAYLYVNDEYDDTDNTQDKLEKIHNLYVTAAQLGDLTAKQELAEEKLYGYNNQQVDTQKALDMLVELAEVNHIGAMVSLADYLYKGRANQKNAENAYKILRALVVKGNIDAIHKMENLLRERIARLSSLFSPKSASEEIGKILPTLSYTYNIGISHGDDKSRVRMAGIILDYPYYFESEKVVLPSLHLLEAVFDENYYPARDWVKANLLLAKTDARDPKKAKRLLNKLGKEIGWIKPPALVNLVDTLPPHYANEYDLENMSKEEWQELREELQTTIKEKIQSIE